MLISLFDWVMLSIIVAAAAYSYRSNKLTLAAALSGGLVAVLIYFGTGAPGLLMLAVFFILGTAVTSYKHQYKVNLQLAALEDRKRTTGQVFANGGVPAIIGLFSMIIAGDRTVFEVMVAGSLAAATGDTFSSELGNVYGRNFFNILNFRRDQRGLNGVISLEGTFFGLVGSSIIALLFVTANGWTHAFFAIIIAGLAGNLFDSLLGALFERRGIIGNDTVNFLNTAFAAAGAFFFLKVFN